MLSFNFSDEYERQMPVTFSIEAFTAVEREEGVKFLTDVDSIVHKGCVGKFTVHCVDNDVLGKVIKKFITDKYLPVLFQDRFSDKRSVKFDVYDSADLTVHARVRLPGNCSQDDVYIVRITASRA